MQQLHSNTTLQGGKYRIERVLGQVALFANGSRQKCRSQFEQPIRLSQNK